MQRRRVWIWLTSGVMLMLICFVAAISIGTQDVSLRDQVEAIVAFDRNDVAHLASREIRLPRAVVAIMVGASLASAGAIMQGVTQNPLAGPSIMGLTPGATVGLLIGVLTVPTIDYNLAVVLSLIGASIGYASVYLVASFSRAGLTPVRIALAGMVVSATLSSVTQGLTLAYGMHDEMLYWTAGGIAGVGWHQVYVLLPLFVAGTTGAMVIAPSVTVLNLGEQVAVGLGQRTRLTRTTATLCVLCLTASATAVAGPIGFVGLLTPHAVRLVIGHDYRWLIPSSAFFGACLTLLADTAARALGGDQEIPMGLLITMLGAPGFVCLARNHASRR